MHEGNRRTGGNVIQVSEGNKKSGNETWWQEIFYVTKETWEESILQNK